MDEVTIIYHYLKSKNISDPVMIDVGAHSGGALRNFAADGWEVFAFEPNPVIRQKCIENIESWKVSENVHLYNCALSDSDSDQIEFYISDESTGISSLIPFHKSHKSKYKVDVSTFTTWETKNNLKKVDFFKIDVEGNDIKVLKGFNWEKFSPQAIIVEFEDNKTESLNITMLDIFHFLKSKGYQIVASEWNPIERYGIEHTWNRFILENNINTYNKKGWGNLIAVKDLDLELFINSLQTASNEEIQRQKKTSAHLVQLLNSLKNSRLIKLQQAFHKVRSLLG